MWVLINISVISLEISISLASGLHTQHSPLTLSISIASVLTKSWFPHDAAAGSPQGVYRFVLAAANERRSDKASMPPCLGPEKSRCQWRKRRNLIYLLTFQQNASDGVPKERAKSYEKWTQSTVEHTGNFTPQHKLAAPTHVISSLHVLSRIQFYRNSNVITNAIRDASILARFSSSLVLMWNY